MVRYEMARKLNPTLDQTEFFLGLAYADLGEFDTAIGLYRRALELNWKNADAECNLAGLLVMKKMPGEARRHFERSLALKPQQVLARKELADLQSDAGEYDAAIENYLAALKLQPDFAQARAGLGLAQSMAKK
jgi:tetratricopeptide (TPR) repeat protein